ncbi:MAG: hypothetical protein FJ301_02550 [Planctomycetes bacterium]|nr:hypothetical protein [Planctomycetota bacterium]
MTAFVANHAVAAAASFLALVALGACALEPDENASVQAVQFQDVVVPSGLQIRESTHQSWSREDAGFRQGHLEYYGQNDVTVAADYVRQRMPQHNWSKVTDGLAENGDLKIRFERDIYRADYTFSRSDGATKMVVDYTTDYARRDPNRQ